MSDSYELRPRYDKKLILKKDASVKRRLKGTKGLYLKMTKLSLLAYMLIPENFRDTLEKGDYSDLIKIGIVDFFADKFSHGFNSNDDNSGTSFRDGLKFPVQPPHFHGPAHHHHGGPDHER